MQKTNATIQLEGYTGSEQYLLLVVAFLSFNINYKVLAGSHKMGRVDTQLIGFLLSSFFLIFLHL